MRGITSGRGSNLIGATFSPLALAFGATGVGTGLSAAAGFGTAGFACGGLVIATFALTGFIAGLVGFTVTFDVAMGFAFVGGRAAFLGAAALRAAFLGVALPGRLAALLGFFEGILVFRLLTKERAIIPTHSGLYRARAKHISLS
jgi:hypothetical protein